MRFVVIALGCLLLGLSSCADGTAKTDAKKDAQVKAKPEGPTSIYPVYDYEGLRPLLAKDDGKTYIVNFWATWCKPCVKELPHFEKVYEETKKDDVELILVSLDMPRMWKDKLEPFVKENNLKGKVVILNDPKMNDWIPKVSEVWEGGIPATLIYKGGQRLFHEGSLTYAELKKEVDKFIL